MVKRDFIRNIVLLLIIGLVLLLLRIFVFSLFKVHADAANSYLSNGDVVMVNRHQDPNYKDFVVYEVDGTFYISRVIGLAGESVTVMDDILYVNDSVKEEPYISQIKSDYLAGADVQQAFTSDFSVATITDNHYTKIPEAEYLVLNDNRQNVRDSRTFGLIKRSQIRGVITFKVLPLTKFGFIRTE